MSGSAGISVIDSVRRDSLMKLRSRCDRRVRVRLERGSGRKQLPMWTASSHNWQPLTTRRYCNFRELNMHRLQGLNRVEPVVVEQSTQFVDPEGPDRTGRATMRPTRLKDEDFLEAVSR